LAGRKKLLGIVALLVLALTVTLGGFALSARAASGRTTLHGSAPTWANSKTYVNAANPTDNIGFRVYLGWNNESAVQALAQAVSDPHSSSYGQYCSRSAVLPGHAEAGSSA
jgi:hypothetical protein